MKDFGFSNVDQFIICQKSMVRKISQKNWADKILKCIFATFVTETAVALSIYRPGSHVQSMPGIVEIFCDVNQVCSIYIEGVMTVSVRHVGQHGQISVCDPSNFQPNLSASEWIRAFQWLWGYVGIFMTLLQGISGNYRCLADGRMNAIETGALFL